MQLQEIAYLMYGAASCTCTCIYIQYSGGHGLMLKAHEGIFIRVAFPLYNSEVLCSSESGATCTCTCMYTCKCDILSLPVL